MHPTPNDTTTAAHAPGPPRRSDTVTGPSTYTAGSTIAW